MVVWEKDQWKFSRMYRDHPEYFLPWGGLFSREEKENRTMVERTRKAVAAPASREQELAESLLAGRIRLVERGNRLPDGSKNYNIYSAGGTGEKIIANKIYVDKELGGADTIYILVPEP